MTNTTERTVLEGTKVCFTCKQEIDINLFYRNKAKSTGLYGSCIECFKKTLKYPKSSDNTIVYLDKNLVKEKWVPIVINNQQFPYLISNCGRVKILSRDKIAKPSYDQRSYPQIVICGGGKRISRRLHVLVASAFIKNKHNLPQVNHKDGNKLNPHYSNLEWSTSLDNVSHAIKNKLRLHYSAISKPVLNTVTKKEYESIQSASLTTHISYYNLRRMLRGDMPNTSTFIYK